MSSITYSQGNEDQYLLRFWMLRDDLQLRYSMSHSWFTKEDWNDKTFGDWEVVNFSSGYPEGPVVLDYQHLLLKNDQAVVYVMRGYATNNESKPFSIRVCSSSFSECETIIDYFRKKLPKAKYPPNDKVDVSLWTDSVKGPVSRNTTIDAPRWAEIERNYGKSCYERLGPLFTTKPTGDAGRLILWHGIPGTGKTNAVRSLMLQWKTELEARYVADPEQFFANPNYMFDVICQGGSLMKLIIIEDADEFLQADAKRARGQSVGRLLNLTDGIMGQGMNFLILITTNEHIDKLHPAVIRPGRCLANVEFPGLTHTEASDWLGFAPAHRDCFSLAELYDMKRTQGQILLKDEKPLARTGQYL